MSENTAKPSVARILFAWLGLAGSLPLISACSDGVLLGGDPGPAVWVAQGIERAWVYPPGVSLVMERQWRNRIEQKLALPNGTSLTGDNFVFLQTVSTDNPQGMRLERALESIDGLPSPFSEDDLSAMRSREDSAGSLAWAEWTSGAGTTCVLALRRLTLGERVLPERVTALDMVMRNCVRGSADEALAPIDARHVAFPSTSEAPLGAAQRILSPLAAPIR